MPTKSTDESLVPGPPQQGGGEFVLVALDERVEAPSPQADEDPRLALGSDVHDVGDLERQLGVGQLDDLLKAYLDDE